jgi:hypothetical protein
LDYNPIKASKVAKYFVDNDFQKSDVDRFINTKVPKVLKQFAINIVAAPSFDELKEHQIDEKKMRSSIVEAYKAKDQFFEETEKDYTIQKDINSINAINKLRQGRHPRNIKEARYLFITTNAEFAFICRKLEVAQFNDFFWIPSCITDIFAGTQIWLSTPHKWDSMNRQRIIADAYAALQPDTVLLKQFIAEVEKLKKDDKISSEEFYVLRASSIARNILMEKTCGDPEAFMDQTTMEVLEVIKEDAKKEYKEKYYAEKEKNNITQEILDQEMQRRKKIEEIFSVLTTIVSYTIVSVLFFATLFCLLIHIGFPDRTWIKFQYTIVSALSLVFGLGFGYSFKTLRYWLKRKLDSAVLKI